jgi:GTPase SAR1 family protein
MQTPTTENKLNYNFPQQPEPSATSEAIKVTLVGDPGVGVRSLHLRLIDGVFVKNARNFPFRIPTEYKLHDVLVNNKKHRLMIYDSCTRKGINPALDLQKEQYFSKVCFSDARAILLCYSPDIPSSYINLNQWLQLITPKAPSNIIIYILALKSDLNQPNPFPINSTSQVDSMEAKKYAESLNLPFFEISALTGQGTKELFASIIKDIEDAKRQNLQLSQSQFVPANGLLQDSQYGRMSLSTPEKVYIKQTLEISFKNSPNQNTAKKASLHVREQSRHKGDDHDVIFN